MEKRYLGRKCISRGTFGVVHMAVDRATGRAFAIKSAATGSASVEATLHLESEIKILKQLSSPYIVEYIGGAGDIVGKARGLCMELVPGGNAAEVAVRYGGLGERKARGVLRRLAAALRYLHSDAGVVHGDVKGQNVLMGADANGDGAKLADFGTAILLSDAGATPHCPRGTPAWMAPEVARGGVAMPASDVWSLGCTALELLTGKQPWSELGRDCEVGELLFLIGFGGKLPGVPAGLSGLSRDFLHKCLRLDAGHRWTCEQLLHHPFLADEHAHDDSSEPSTSPRMVFDWVMSELASEALDGVGPEREHEIMVRAKDRVAALASSLPRASWEEEELEWGTSLI